MIANRNGKVAGLLVFTAICVLIFTVLFVKAGGDLPGGAKKYEAKVLVPTAFQLVPNGDVRRAGVTIGKVERIDSRGSAGLVSIAVDRDQGPLYRDATVTVRTKTLVGENYLDIDPGSPRAGELRDGGVLPLAQAGEAVQLDEILSGLDAETRAAVRKNLDALGPGLDGRGADLNRLIGVASPTLERVDQLTTLLDSQKDQLARVVDDTGRVMQAIADRTGDVRRLATQAKNTADAAASRDRELSAVLATLPATLRQVRSTTTHLGRVSRSSTPVVRDLRLAVRELPPVTRRLASASKAGRELFDVLPSFSKSADPMLASLRAFSGDAKPIVPALDRVLGTLRPALAYMKPYARDIASGTGLLGDAVNSADQTGKLARVHVVVDENTINGLPLQIQKIVTDLTNIGSVQGLHRSGNDPYPAPGTRATPGPSAPAPKLEPDPGTR